MKPDTLIFDLDDTLYPPDLGVWEHIGDRIELYLHTVFDIPIGQVTTVRKALFHEYGTTLRGLQILYNVDPHDYLKFVHDIPIQQYLQPAPQLRAALEAVPHRKVIFTNADFSHAQRVIRALGLDGLFDKVIDIIDVMPFCKPQPEAFGKAFEHLGITDPALCALFDDSPRNIRTARALGIFTIHVGKNSSHITGDLNINSLEDILSVFTPDYSLRSGSTHE